jgi:hypothetical protein
MRIFGFDKGCLTAGSRDRDAMVGVAVNPWFHHAPLRPSTHGD